jgi:hypothetical protein
MPIRLNLLAEAQAAEEMRRKDPVKRASYFGGLCLLAVACVSIIIQSQVMATKSRAQGLLDRISGITNEYAVVVQDKARWDQVELHRRGLDILASERFLYGTFLNSLQGVYVEGVQMIHIRTDHSYAFIDEVRTKATGGTPAKVTKPALATENISIVLEARDVSSNPGEQVTRYKEKLGELDYIVTLLSTNNQLRLVNRSPPQIQPDTGRLGVQFTLESRVPEKVRLGIASPVRYGTSAMTARGGEPAKSSGTEVGL